MAASVFLGCMYFLLLPVGLCVVHFFKGAAGQMKNLSQIIPNLLFTFRPDFRHVWIKLLQTALTNRTIAAAVMYLQSPPVF